MTREQFINKNYHKLYHHLCEEGYELGYTDDEIDDYFENTKQFIFVGTKEEIAEEPGHEDFYVIAEEDGLVMAEVFNGISYDFIKNYLQTLCNAV